MKNKYLRALVTFIMFSVTLGIFPQENNIPEPGIGKEGQVLEDLKAIWPDGKCADHVSGDKRYTLISFACKGSFSAKNREAFLELMVNRTWKIKKENYHIEKESASYFYKFERPDNRNIYFKLFFREPQIIWPLHENHRPQIAVVLNNVDSANQLENWAKFKIPLTISLSLNAADFQSISEKSTALSYDTWIYLPDITPENDNDVDKQLLENLTRISGDLGKNPEQTFRYTGLTVSNSFVYLKNIDVLRQIFSVMKMSGLKKFLSPETLEVKDTARILEINAITSTYFLGGQENANKLLWHDAYENAKKNGYSVIVVDAGDKAAESFLLGMLEQSISYVDLANMIHLPQKENLDGQK